MTVTIPVRLVWTLIGVIGIPTLAFVLVFAN